MEIKQGDKVRVSKDAPRMYVRGWSDVLENSDCKVDGVEDDNAIITNGPRIIAIPTKYLIKVESEAKEPTAPKIAVGDMVEELISRKRGRALDIDGDFVVVGIPYNREKHYWHINDVELVSPSKLAEEKPNVGSIKIPVEVDLADSYWDAYAVELAKEIALKVANKYNDPKEAAEYAVQVAKAVVGNLKNK